MAVTARLLPRTAVALDAFEQWCSLVKAAAVAASFSVCTVYLCWRNIVCASRRKGAWSWGSVHWRTVVSSVQWGSLIVMLLCTLVPYLIYHAVSEPHERAFLLYDADISHPKFPDTVKGWMAPVFPFLLLFVTVGSRSMSDLRPVLWRAA